MEGKSEVWVVGHKNPDTDSICSAIAYAELKNKITNRIHVPKRAGELNGETRYVLNALSVEEPECITYAGTQVSDIGIRKIKGVPANLSLRRAYQIMKEQDVMTLAVTEQDKLIGMITIGDIATSDMDVHDNRILSKANTEYQNIVDVLDGELLVGDIHASFSEGKVVIGAASPELMENFIGEHDMIILGNRFEAQFLAMEMKAGCIILCLGAKASETLLSIARQQNCFVITTPYDTFTVMRLINQSMPISYFMSTQNLVTFHPDDYTDEIKDVMAKLRHRYFAVVDDSDHYIGLISKRSLLAMERKKIILVDHNEKTQAVDGIEDSDILEIIDHHRLGNLETIQPVFFRNQPLGCTATIVYQMYQENQIEISKKVAGLLCAAIISDTLLFRSPTCTPVDQKAAEHLAVIAGLDKTVFAEEMFGAGSNLKNKNTDEIFYQDFKTFHAGETTFGIGQITSMNGKELKEIGENIQDFMDKETQKIGCDMLFFMLTNILEESTDLLYSGHKAAAILESAFGQKVSGIFYHLGGVVSRKKQTAPAILNALQES